MLKSYQQKYEDRSYGNLRNVLWSSSNIDQEQYPLVFSDINLTNIQNQILKITREKIGTGYLVPKDKIVFVLSSLYENLTTTTGDPITRENVPYNSEARSDKVTLTTINFIVTHILNEVRQKTCNENLTVWTTVLGEGNSHNLRSHSHIKVREQRPTPLQFHLNY
jgi:hypothetical protein